jgi:hypothetical protein
MFPSLGDALRSGAAKIVCELERDGFRVGLTPGGAIVITPKSRLTTYRRQQIVDHKAAIKMLLRFGDGGVQDRRDVFDRQLRTWTSRVLVARLVFRETPYVQGCCHACGDALESPRWGSCWRCSLARRLACNAPMSDDLLMAYDEARICT